MARHTIGINGFGRIGRLVLRCALCDKSVQQVAHINDPFLSVDAAAYLFQHDSVHGRFSGSVSTKDGALLIDDATIVFTSERDPTRIPWATSGTACIIESSGAFTTGAAAAMHLTAGAQKVIISAPAKDLETAVIVLGVNEESYDRGSMHVLSNASCTTNCLAPLAKVVNDAFGIEEGMMTTVHAVTASQSAVDGPAKKDWRSGRSILNNIIPASTGAAYAVTRALPELQGKLNGMAFRVPVADVSVVDLVVRTRDKAPMAAVVDSLRKAEAGRMRGILKVTDQMVVSSDFVGEKASAVFDVNASMALNDHMLKLVAWYDNEMGYAQRCVELAAFVMVRQAQAGKEE